MDNILNLLAFCLPLGVFLFFGIVGYAALCLLRTQGNTLQNCLLAPALGMAITVLSIFCASRLSLPVSRFAVPLTLFLSLASLSIFSLKKPPFPFRPYLAFAALFLLAALLIGNPLLEFGFNWLSYANDDMTNYVLAAQRFLNHGYFDIPDSAALSQGKDYSLYYWFLDAILMERTGSQLLLAWLSQLTLLSPLQVFMPLMLTLHLVMISATGALVYQAAQWRPAALTLCFLMASSGLAALGTLYQLMAQVAGLALLPTACIFLLQPFTYTSKQHLFRDSLLISITVSALLITYTEVAPLLALAFILYHLLNVTKKWATPRALLSLTACTFILCLLLLNTYWINIVAFLNVQIHASLFVKQSIFIASLFPYFLIPSGLADLWNLQVLSIQPAEPLLSISIALGGIFTALAIYLAFSQTFKKNAAATMLVVMLLLSLILFKNNNGFGLFKLVMYMQPFLLSVVAIGLFTVVPQKTLRFAIILIFATVGIKTEHSYVYYSRGSASSPFVELPNASITQLTREAQQLSQWLPRENAAPIIVDNRKNFKPFFAK
jgi:hypothetical protein